MPINWNSEILDGLPGDLLQAQRACLYADGLFETLRMSNGALPWLSDHWRRLRAGLEALEFELPAHWDERFWAAEIKKIASGNARIRWQVWRAPGGWYLPENRKPVYLLTAEPLENAWFTWQTPGIRIGPAVGIRISSDALSGFKGIDAIRYVAAALEARRNGWDEAIVLNTADRVAEAASANVFWWENDALCTPPCSEGCVAGIARSRLIGAAKDSEYAVFEKSVTFAALQAADEVFLTNAVRGIIPVADIGGRALPVAKTKRLFGCFAGTLAG